VSAVLQQLCPAVLLCAQVKEGKKAKFKLGVYDPKLGSAIQETTSIPCIANEMVGGAGDRRPPLLASHA